VLVHDLDSLVQVAAFDGVDDRRVPGRGHHGRRAFGAPVHDRDPDPAFQVAPRLDQHRVAGGLDLEAVDGERHHLHVGARHG